MEGIKFNLENYSNKPIWSFLVLSIMLSACGNNGPSNVSGHSDVEVTSTNNPFRQPRSGEIGMDVDGQIALNRHNVREIIFSCSRKAELSKDMCEDRGKSLEIAPFCYTHQFLPKGNQVLTVRDFTYIVSELIDNESSICLNFGHEYFFIEGDRINIQVDPWSCLEERNECEEGIDTCDDKFDECYKRERNICDQYLESNLLHSNFSEGATSITIDSLAELFNECLESQSRFLIEGE